MKRIALIALALCVLIALIGGAGLWRSATIVVDTTPPEIRETAPRDGENYVVSGTLTVKCWVYENMELDSVNSTIYKKTWLGWSKLETIKLSFKEELAGDIYLYEGSFTEEGWKLKYDTEYKLRFEAVDKAGNSDSHEAKFTAVEASPIEGYVTVNGKRVEGSDDVIYVRSLDLTIKVYITAGEDQLDTLVLMLNGEFIRDFTRRVDRVLGRVWYETSYTLPREGRYEFSVYAYDTLAEAYQLASFTIVMENRMRNAMLIGAAVVLGLVAAYGYLSQGGGRRGR